MTNVCEDRIMVGDSVVNSFVFNTIFKKLNTGAVALCMWSSL